MKLEHICTSFGLYAFNNKIPIRDDILYLVWQPDQAFNMLRFPIKRTLVIAYQQKTSYKTFIIDDSINYLELFRSILSIG